MSATARQSITTRAFLDVVHPTDEMERALLRSAGYIHVTGLQYASRLHGNVAGIPTPKPRDLGRWDMNNSTDVIVTTGGETWLAKHSNESFSQLDEQIRQARKTLAPNGQGVFVPCSNGEVLGWFDTIRRHADPNWDPHP